ncbi:MAG: prenyltransferase/squalene oxidase repeat-containing protein [Anaerovoracaceae bacterium]
MFQKRKTIVAIMLVVMLLITGCGAKNLEENLNNEIKDLGNIVLEKTPEATVSSVGGEWAVIGLSQSGVKVDENYYNVYLDNVRAKVKSTKGKIDGNFTDSARIILALTAIGKSPKNIEGYDLTKEIDNYGEAVDQGINGVAYGLIASNSCDTKLKNEEKYVDYLLNSQLKDGSFTFDEGGQSGQIDVTAMVIQALSYYKDRPEINKAINKATKFLSGKQLKDGTMGSCEATCQTIIGLRSIGINPFEEETFIKEKATLGNSLLEFKVKEGFAHKVGEEPSGMATEQSLLAMAALKKIEEKKGLYE